MPDYINKEMCNECKGACCKRNSCGYLPEDFQSMDYDYLLDRIKQGNITVTFNTFEVHRTLELIKKFNKEDFIYNLWSYYVYLMARNNVSDIVDFNRKPGICTMLDVDGCKYSDEERPSLGLSVIPTQVGGLCVNAAKDYRLEIIYDWVKHQEVLERIIHYFTGKDSLQLLKEVAISDWILSGYMSNGMDDYINPQDGIIAELEYNNKTIDPGISVRSRILNRE